jgi:molybdenum cofactor cytidylyltransferase
MSGSVALVLLAAGRGSRFGGGKLAAPLAGKPVIAHVAAATQTLPLAQRILVAASDVPDLPGFTRVAIDPPDARNRAHSRSAWLPSAMPKPC